MKKMIIIITVLVLYYALGQFLSFYIPCPIHYLTGYYCPGCGVTRMLTSIIKLDFYQAFHYNMLIFLLIPFFVTYFIFQLSAFLKTKKNVMNGKSFNKVWITLVVVFLVFGILRNTDTFSFLAPTRVFG
ncbi:MAG: DUF2752 domain-containing protein [Bacilli bacterium]|nr:DUF2752 domain-containing protein [Bacilli bacterium]